MGENGKLTPLRKNEKKAQASGPFDHGGGGGRAPWLLGGGYGRDKGNGGNEPRLRGGEGDIPRLKGGGGEGLRLRSSGRKRKKEAPLAGEAVLATASPVAIMVIENL